MSSDIACTGRWIRWADGPVLGSTLTLTSRNGSFLVAFLALYVSFVGGQFWTILKFLIHQWRAKRRPKDALHHQQQGQYTSCAFVAFSGTMQQGKALR